MRSRRREEGGAGLPGLPQRIKHQSHSAAALTIIKMPQLKGDILYLRLFVSIKCIPQLLTHPEHRGGEAAGRPRANGNPIRFIKATGPALPETFNFAGVTSKESSLSTFASLNSPLALSGPSEHPRARGAVTDQLRGNSEPERGDERRSPPLQEDLLQHRKMDEISLSISFSDCFSFLPLCVR